MAAERNVSPLLTGHGQSYDFPEERAERVQRIATRFNSELGHEVVHPIERDGSGYAVDGHAPGIVVAPATPDAVAATLELAAEMRAVVTPWGGGTQMALGYPLAPVDVVLSLERLGAVIAHDAAELTTTVQAGCTVNTLNTTLAPSRQFVPLEGALGRRATVGGRLATGSTGLLRMGYGHPRTFVQGLLIARSDGTLFHTNGALMHQIAGYDLNKLFVGSLGTLGVIVEATLRLAYTPVSEATVVAAFDDPSAIWSLLEDLNASLMQPITVAACGPGCLGADRGLSVEHADMLQPAAHPLLLVRLAGLPLAVRKNALSVRALALKYGAQMPLLLYDEPMQRLWASLEDLPATTDLLPTEAVMKVAALPSEIGKAIEVVRVFCMEHELRLCWSTDAVAGTAWLRVMGGDGDMEHFGAGLRALQEMLARRWRNSVVLGCAPALKPRLSLWGADPQGLDLMRALKGKFDPIGILNPGRFG